MFKCSNSSFWFFLFVDNEYWEDPISHGEYFASLEDVYRAADIVVPLTYNDPGQGKNFINGTVRTLPLVLTKQSLK